ncbi:MAG: uroporphyrinogen decarboxylase family protein [Bacilli bacterium]|jgi:uroporphyrinogen decarboxylase|nr:uroporphyrinogen decarboxylase family protein [Bacilli bacterium]HHU23637.1 methyltransferase [Acholeplasmataceae bacterium]
MKKTWITNQLNNRHLTMPVLSTPTVQIMGITVNNLILSSHYQAQAIQYLANNYPISAAVTIMDLSVEAECFGAEIRSFDNEIPTVIGIMLKTPEYAANLQIPKVGEKRTQVYLDTVKKAKELVDIPVFAGVIGPFSLSGRLMGMTEVMMNCYLEPEMVKTTLEKVSPFITEYIKAFKANGADGVIIAEPAAGLLSPELCEEFSSHYLKQIVKEVKDDNFVVVYHNCGNTVPLVESIVGIDADVYHFGNMIDLAEILKLMPRDKVVMGNVDPARIFKNGTPEMVYNTTLSLLEKCHRFENFVISSGCDIPANTGWENINAYFNAIKTFYAK